MQFLTRVPVPVVRDFSPDEFSRSSAWFPFVGVFIGALVSVTIYICAHRNATLATALGLLIWVWTTGALHLDGLADLTDALAASHRDKDKFFFVLADPHIGALGVASIVMALLLKATALAGISIRDLFIFPLIPAWARLGPLAWSRWLKPLKPGHGERFSSHLNAGWIVFWTVALLATSAVLAPILCMAPVVIAAWGLWLKQRLGGTTGDCLGAGVEVTEVVLLCALVLA